MIAFIVLLLLLNQQCNLIVFSPNKDTSVIAILIITYKMLNFNLE